MQRALVVLGTLIVLAAGGAAVVRGIDYRGAAKPGVSVLGVDVGGKSRAEIQSALRTWAARPVTIRAGGHSYHLPRGWLVAVDVHATATRALGAGSTVSLLVPEHHDVSPVVRRAGRAGNVLRELARAGRPAASAQVVLHGTQAVVTPAQVGRQLDSAELVHRLARNGDVVDAPFAVSRPAILDPAARSAASTAELLLARPVSISYHGAQLGALTPVQLARALRIRSRTHRFAVGFDADALARVVRPRLGRWITHAHNAQFAVSGDLVHVVASRPGRDVDPLKVVVAVTKAAHTDHAAAIELGARDAELSTAKANALGIRRKLVSYTTQMGDSSSNRIHNVHLMAAFIDGTVIKPGAEFSFNDVVGERTSARGFLEGQMIIGSLVLPSIGGGVCQTATTLFNDAFELGLPILERTNHNLYLAHYPIGRDATVSWGGPDFKFRNDLEHGLLIKTTYTDSTLTFIFYGTSEHRRVVSRTSSQTNWTGPSMNYAVDPTAPRGSVKVVAGTGEQGFDVTVDRTVYDASGAKLRSDTFRSHYIPDSPTTVYGPGKTPPGPYIVLPSSI
ncbi:MAG: VanW family protein [Actinobacteria bacterium]|nr:VanW family protein [Actinomycetota bacterium]